jgi:hypothetical protein
VPTTTSAPPLLLTCRDAAAVLAISMRTLWSLTAPRGPIHPVRVRGRSIRYAVSELQRWIDSQQGGAQP